MKVVFIGGGSYHLLPILRGLMGAGRIVAGGEIDLYDLSPERAEAMGRMAMKTPEFQTADCRISWPRTLDEALPGADAVAVILMGGSQESHARGMVASAEHGFLASDNVSLNGAFLAVKTAAILQDLADRMRVHCPRALLVNFANPTAVLSGMINNHTRIRAAGICAGAGNHEWDLMRLMGKDEQGCEFDVDAAGVNHMSFILKGTYRGEDLFNIYDRLLNDDWKPPALMARWGEVPRRGIADGLKYMARIYRELGVLMFSSEFDGLSHLCYEEMLERNAEERQALLAMPYEERVKSRMRIMPDRRREMAASFNKHLNAALDRQFWDHYWEQDHRFGRDNRHIIVKLLRGLSGAERAKVVFSRPNGGAVAGFKDRTVLEYSHFVLRDEIVPAGHYEIPDSVHGMTGALAAHQTLLGDAIADQDPRKLAQALMAYPIRPYSRALRTLCLELAEINRDEMPAPLRTVNEFL